MSQVPPDNPPPLFSTSHAAGEAAARSSGHRRAQILQLLRQHGPLCLFEVAELMEVHDHQISGRFTDMSADGLIERTGQTRVNPATGCAADVWQIAAARPAYAPEETRDVIARHLTQAGHCALSAANGWEALITLDKQPVDVILLDVMMPGMDGPTFYRIFDRSRLRKTPVIVMTALDVEEARKRVGNGIDAVIEKSGDFYAELLKAVAQHSEKPLTDTPQN